MKDSLAPHPALVEEHPLSIYEVLPEWFSEYVRQVPVEYLLVDANQLRGQLKPSLYLESLRTAFWLEYNAAVLNGRKMDVKRLYQGLVSREFYFSKIVKVFEVFAFVLTPPVDYAVGMEAMLKTSLERMHEILTLPLKDKDGETDHKTVALILKAHESIMYRQLGAPVTRNIDVVKTIGNIPSDIELERMERSIDERMQKTVSAVHAIGQEFRKAIDKEEELDDYEKAIIGSGAPSGVEGEGSGS